MLLIADRLVHVNLETEFRYSLPNLTLTMQALPYLATQIHSYNFLGVNDDYIPLEIYIIIMVKSLKE